MSRFYLNIAIELVASAAVLSAVLILLLRPLLRRYALARPNARSLHREPTPQGGGIAVIVATLAIGFAGALRNWPDRADTRELFVLSITAVGLPIVGGIDD